MTGRHGFALITVLWLVVVLGALVTTGLTAVDTSRLAAENRIHAKRARWAARGCLALAQARHAANRSLPVLDSVALGAVTWCGLESADPGDRINPNAADSVGLARVLGVPVAAALLDWMDADDVPRRSGAESAWYRRLNRHVPRNAPLAAVDEMRLVRGFEDAGLAMLEGLFTTRGNGRVSPNRARARVLSSVGAVPRMGVGTLLAVREMGRRFRDAADVASVLGLELTTAEFRALSARLSFDDVTTTVRVRGFSNAGGRVLRAEAEVDLRQTAARLSVLRIVPR